MAITSINIQSYLNFAKMIHALPQQDFWTAYDAKADILYIWTSPLTKGHNLCCRRD